MIHNSLEKVLTKEILEKKYKELKTFKNMAKYFNCTDDVISKYIKKFALKNKHHKRKYNCNDNFFSELNEQSLYWSGFLAADGTIMNKHSLISMELCDVDENHLEKFKKNINCECAIYKRSRKSPFKNCENNIYHYASIKITSEQMVKDLKKFNVVQNKTYIYNFPEILLENKYLPHYIRGYWEGDGSIGFNNVKLKYNYYKRPVISLLGNKKFIESIIYIFDKKLNINKYYLTKNKKSLQTYQLSYHRINDILKILHYLYDDATIYLDRKYEKAKFIMENYK